MGRFSEITKIEPSSRCHFSLFYVHRAVHNESTHLAAGANNASTTTNADSTVSPPASLEDGCWCDEVAQLLLEGKKGEELMQAVRNLDRARECEQTSLAASGLSSPGGASSPPPAHQPYLHMPLPVPGMSPGFFNSQRGMI